MSEHKRDTVLAKKVRFYYNLIKRTYDYIVSGNTGFIERYITERDKTKDPVLYHKLYIFTYVDKLYASNEELINAAIDRSESEFEDWYFEDYLLNKSKYKSILIKN